jgi:hypothetical protein
MTPPLKTQYPNFKINELFRWLRYIWKEAWELAEDLSIDEQSCKMQGKSEYKTHCGKFKRLGDGIQGNCFANYGYAWDFNFEMSPSIQSSLRRDIVPCTANCSTCFRICVRVFIAAQWITFLILSNFPTPCFALRNLFLFTEF